MKRIWEIDALRGLAILLMIVFHFVYDLDYLGFASVRMYSGFWYYFWIVIPTLFLLLVGISLTLSYNRARKKHRRRTAFFKYLKRGAKVFGFGLIITAVTYVFLPRGTVLFGILHLIGVSIILAYPFLKLRYANLALGAAIVLLGEVISQLTINSKALLWLGVRPASFYTLDYFPLIPWFGLVLAGIGLGNLFYTGGARRFNLPQLAHKLAIKPLCWLGRHALKIYLAHQPIILAALYAVRYLV